MTQEISFLSLGLIISEHIFLKRPLIRHQLYLFYQSIHQSLYIEHTYIVCTVGGCEMDEGD